MEQRKQPEGGRSVAVEDVLHPDVLARDSIDEQYLRDVFRDSRRYLPPPPHPHLEPEPELDVREPESSLVRRAKLIALIIASLLVIASIVAAALLSNQPASAQGLGVALPRL